MEKTFLDDYMTRLELLQLVLQVGYHSQLSARGLIARGVTPSQELITFESLLRQAT